MTQTETNAALEIGLEVNFMSWRRTIHKAIVTKLHAHEHCDLDVYIGNFPARRVCQIPYDSDGNEGRSWHKKSDVIRRVEVT